MPAFSDFLPRQFIYYDVTPEQDFAKDEFGISDNEAFVNDPEADEPGAGETFQGTDPTAFNEQDTVLENETATTNDPVSFGQSDDPESKEQIGDVAEGDNEDDDSDPADIYPELIDDVRFPGLAIDADELTIELIEDAEKDIISSPIATKEAYVPTGFLDEPLLNDLILSTETIAIVETDFDPTKLELFIEEDVSITPLSAFVEGMRVLRTVTLSDLLIMFSDDTENNDLSDFFTTPSLLTGFADVIGSVDLDTFLVEFQSINMDDV